MLLSKAAVPCWLAGNAAMLIVVVRYIYTKVLEPFSFWPTGNNDLIKTQYGPSIKM
jgi:hypothetical protein